MRETLCFIYANRHTYYLHVGGSTTNRLLRMSIMMSCSINVSVLMEVSERVKALLSREMSQAWRSCSFYTSSADRSGHRRFNQSPRYLSAPVSDIRSLIVTMAQVSLDGSSNGSKNFRAPTSVEMALKAVGVPPMKSKVEETRTP